MKNKRLLGLGCAFFSTICWASNYPVFRLIFNRGGIDDLDEWWSSWLRTFLCLVVMFPFAFTQKADGLDKFRKNWKQDWKIFLFLGMMLVLEASVCFAAAKYTTAARTSLFANTSPVFTLLISFLFAKEVLTGRKITGILMGLAGIVLAAFSRGSDAFTAGLSTLGGDLLAILSGVFWALFTVFGGDASSKYNGAFCTVIYRAFGSLVLVPVLFFCNVELNLPWKVWMGLLYLAVIPGGIAVWVWSIAQKYVEPGVLGSFGYLSAFSATLFSVLFLEEKITLPFILAFALILGGMALIIKQSRKEKETKTV